MSEGQIELATEISDKIRDCCLAIGTGDRDDLIRFFDSRQKIRTQLLCELPGEMRRLEVE